MKSVKLSKEVAKMLELKKEYFKLKMAFWQGDAVKTHSFKRIKKDIARIMTVSTREA
jgi:ribosomal protein L29